MAKITTTRVYKINRELVVADNIEDAVKIYREYLASFGDFYPEIESVILVNNDNIPSSPIALIRGK